MGHWYAFFVGFLSLSNRFQIWIGPYSVMDSVTISLCEKGLPSMCFIVSVIKEFAQQQQT